MRTLRYTLAPDGPSDVMLLPLLGRLLREYLPTTPVQDQAADYRRLPRMPKGLADRVRLAVTTFPCDLLFVHRDAERDDPGVRREEIEAACAALAASARPQHVCVIPVRMSEAWLLTSESAVRAAAGNSTGKVKLDMPAVKRIEALPDPKTLLYDLLRTASELTGRRRDKLRPQALVRLVADFTEDLSPLKRLPAFKHLDDEIAAFAAHWTAAVEEE